jgi:hypothetical protein
MSDSNGDIVDSDTEFSTVDDLAKNQKLIDCYQIQVDDNNRCSPVHLGKYPDVPLPVNKVIQYDGKYKLHVVTYVLTEEEVQNKLYKIVGVNVFRNGEKNSMCSLDLVMGENGGYELLYNDHKNNTTKVVEKLEKFPGKDKVLEYIIKKAFDEPLKSVLTK